MGALSIDALVHGTVVSIITTSALAAAAVVTALLSVALRNAVHTYSVSTALPLLIAVWAPWQWL